MSGVDSSTNTATHCYTIAQIMSATGSSTSTTPHSLTSTATHCDVERRGQESSTRLMFAEDLVPWISYARPKYANPSPLGLFSFANTVLIVSFVNARTRGITTPHIMVSMALCVGGLVQLISGMFEFCVGNTFAMTVSCSYGAYWTAFGLLYWPSSGILAAYESTRELNDALGLLMFVWFVFTVIMTVGALQTSLGLFLVLGGVAIVYLLMGIGHLLDKALLFQAAGVIGCCTAFVAYYTAAGDLFRTVGMRFSLANPALLKKSD